VQRAVGMPRRQLCGWDQPLPCKLHAARPPFLSWQLPPASLPCVPQELVLLEKEAELLDKEQTLAILREEVRRSGSRPLPRLGLGNGSTAAQVQ